MTVDPGEFELALLNIAVNTRNAMPNGGTFRLVARNTRCGGETASGGLVGEFVAITLTDTGRHPSIKPRFEERAQCIMRITDAYLL